MTQSLQGKAPAPSTSRLGRQLGRPWALTATAIVCGLSFGSACGDDDEVTLSGGGSGGRAGSTGVAGSAGSVGRGGMGGSGGAENGAGVIRVLSADAARLNTPTTAAIRGNNLWVVNGQLTGLFGFPPPAVPPFNVVSVPLAGGDVGATDIVLGNDDIYPEGIAAAADGTLYIGSLNLGVIYRVPATSTTVDTVAFVPGSVVERGVLGLTVDQERGLLWFCDSSPGQGGALVGVDLDDGTQTVRHAMPDPVASVPDAGTDAGDAGTDAGDAGDGAAPPPPVTTICNDVIVDEDDVIFITDSSGRIFRIPANAALTANSAAVWLEHPAIAPPTPNGFGANGIDVIGDHLIISNGNLVAVDRTSTNPASTVQVISLTEGGAAATLCGPDGLQAVPGTNDIVVVENGFCPTGVQRVIRVTLDLD